MKKGQRAGRPLDDISFSSAPILIVCALEYEAAAIRKRIASGWKRLPSQDAPLFVSNDSRLLLIVCGIGPEQVHRSLDGILAHMRPKLIINAGLCGALDESLQVGDLVCPQTLVEKSGNSLFINEQLKSRQVDEYYLYSSSQIVATAQAKRELRHEAGASIVDQEAASVVAIAADAKVPCLVMKAVSDTADMDLPYGCIELISPSGKLRVGRLVRMLLVHPASIQGLIRMGRAGRLALKQICSCMNQELMSWD